jgi:hypothetical protein
VNFEQPGYADPTSTEHLRKQHCGQSILKDTEMWLTLCAGILRPLRRTPALGEPGRSNGGDELLRYLRGEI